MNARGWIICGALLGAVGVSTGAYGAHGLEQRVKDEKLEAKYHTAVRYQMYHALALILCAVLSRAGYRCSVAAWCFLIGTVIFSGTVYALALGSPRFFGAITPIGGVMLIVGWLALLRGGAAPPQDGI